MILQWILCPKGNEKRQITCGYCTTLSKSCIFTVTTTAHLFYLDMMFAGHIIKLLMSPMCEMTLVMP